MKDRKKPLGQSIDSRRARACNICRGSLIFVPNLCASGVIVGKSIDGETCNVALEDFRLELDGELVEIDGSAVVVLPIKGQRLRYSGGTEGWREETGEIEADRIVARRVAEVRSAIETRNGAGEIVESKDSEDDQPPTSPASQDGGIQ